MKVEIAGRVIEDALEAVERYVTENERMVRDYDLGDHGDPNEISARDVLSTRYTRTRIEGYGLQYFVDESRKAPWELVPPDARLHDADPREEGGLYDDAEEFYKSFFSGRRQGITPAKIHIVLHYKRQELYPLLDGRLEDLFMDAAKEISKDIRPVRRGRRGRLYWAAIRADMLANLDAIHEIRNVLADRDEPASLAGELTDVRIHDILCWELVR